MKKIEKQQGAVYCSTKSLEKLNTLLEDLRPSKIVVLTDTNTQKHCSNLFTKHLNPGTPLHHITIPAGELHKTIDTCLDVWNKLSELKADRKSLLINLGGGVVTDLGGFVACTFKRGIEFINIPTSLLAMVDASVGGKNGVDLGHLKNQIGVIRDPLAVFVNVSFLKTLPKAHITSGYAEMLKHGLIASEPYWRNLENFDSENFTMLEELIWESIKIKNFVVTKDPFEQGLRKTLNYGHTLGHAIESYCLENNSRQDLLHGEAIAIGMILANYISHKTIGFPSEKLKHSTQHILKYFPKVNFEAQEINRVIDLMKFDKKNSNGNINFVLLEDFENYKIDQKVPNTLIHSAFDFYKNF